MAAVARSDASAVKSDGAAFQPQEKDQRHQAHHDDLRVLHLILKLIERSWIYRQYAGSRFIEATGRRILTWKQKALQYHNFYM
jgi:hypothetical protein